MPRTPDREPLLVESWRKLLDPRKAWVLFENDTCVVLADPGTDLAAQARALLAQHGPVHVGSPAGDFAVVSLKGAPGWMVTFDHPALLTYVSPAELDDETADSAARVRVGLLGRSKRAAAAAALRIVHVEAGTPSSGG